MNIEELYNYCMSFPEVGDSMPFGQDIVVFKVKNKIFALFNINKKPTKISCKVLPEENIELQEKYFSVVPGYHLNKKHWATITINGDCPDSEIKRLISDSYKLVSKKK